MNAVKRELIKIMQSNNFPSNLAVNCDRLIACHNFTFISSFYASLTY